MKNSLVQGGEVDAGPLDVKVLRKFHRQQVPVSRQVLAANVPEENLPGKPRRATLRYKFYNLSLVANFVSAEKCALDPQLK